MSIRQIRIAPPSWRGGRLLAAASLALSLSSLSSPVAGGADRVDPHPLAAGVPNEIHGSGLLAVCGLTIDGVAAPILAQSDAELLTEVPASLPLPPPGETRLVEICLEMGACPAVPECKTAFLGGEVFEFALPAVVGNAPTPGCAVDVHVRGLTAFVLQGRRNDPPPTGLLALDVSDPTQPRPVGELAVSEPRQMALDGNFLHVAAAAGLVVIDATDPARLGVVATLPLGSDGPGVVEVAGGHAYLEADGSLVVVDVRDPLQPRHVAELSPGQLGGLEVSEIEAVGDLLLLATIDPASPGPSQIGPLLSVDVSRPDRPRLIDGQSGLVATAVEASCALVFASAGSDALQIDCADLGCIEPSDGFFTVAELADPSHIDPISALDTAHARLAVALEPAGDRLFTTGAADLRAKVLVSDVSDPAAPRLLTARTLPGDSGEGLAVEAGLAYVAGCAGGLTIVDVSAVAGDPADPQSPAPPCSPASPASASSRPGSR